MTSLLALFLVGLRSTQAVNAPSESDGVCKVDGTKCSNALQAEDAVNLLQREIKLHDQLDQELLKSAYERFKGKVHVDKIFQSFPADESYNEVALTQSDSKWWSWAVSSVWNLGRAIYDNWGSSSLLQKDERADKFVRLDSDGNNCLKLEGHNKEHMHGKVKKGPVIYLSKRNKAFYAEIAKGKKNNPCKHSVGVHARVPKSTKEGNVTTVELSKKIGKVAIKSTNDGAQFEDSTGKFATDLEFTEQLPLGSMLVEADAEVKDVSLEDWLGYLDGSKQVADEWCREKADGSSLVQEEEDMEWWWWVSKAVNVGYSFGSYQGWW